MMNDKESEIATAQAERLSAPKIRRLKLRQREPNFNALHFLICRDEPDCAGCWRKMAVCTRDVSRMRMNRPWPGDASI
jgi:hypothetical protein